MAVSFVSLSGSSSPASLDRGACAPFRVYRSLAVPSLRAMLLPLLFSILLSRQALALHCLQPFVPENGHVIFNEPGPYAPKTIAKYSCALGFERIGAEERICRPDGTWSAVPPVCAIDVAAGKPNQQSTGDPLFVLTEDLCATTNNEKRSWWEVELLGSYDVHSLVLRLGRHSSQIFSVELITDYGDIHVCDISPLAKNSSQPLPCVHSHVVRIRVVASARLQICSANVFATNAVSSWQCAQGSMDVLTVVEGLCISASREEHSDWPAAQRKCLDRGGSLPLRIRNSTKRGIQAALEHSDHRKDFFWIGVSSSSTEWRWADGEVISPLDADWPLEQAPQPSRAEAVLLARALEWKWLPAVQSAWNAFLCQSKPKFCTSPGVGEAARVHFSSHSYAIGTHCYYTCDDGYRLVGMPERECLETGRWSGNIPECRKLDCGKLPPFPFGSVRLVNMSTLYLSEAEYICAPGSEVVGDRRRQCQADGKWGGTPPSCAIVDCGRPPSIANGKYETTSHSFDSQANYTCNEGYRLIGHETIFCGEKGVWEPAAPVCYDEAALREMKGSDAEGSAVLAVLALILVGVLLFAVVKISRPTSSAVSDKAPVIYATPSVPMAGDSVVYYASCAAVTQLEVPPHLLSLQHLPNGNIHVTLPAVSGRPMTRPPLPIFREVSPTPSQLLYSFDHEPIYDTPPESTLSRRTAHHENIYERMVDLRPPPPPLPKASHRRTTTTHKNDG